jgi:hypothetical protein
MAHGQAGRFGLERDGGDRMSRPAMSRRTALKLGAAAALAAVSFAPQPALGLPAVVPPGSGGADDGNQRYRFDPVSRRPDLAPLARLEDVWASPAYLAITDCIVSYVGPEPYRLNLAESAAVDVAEAAGAVVVDRHATFLLILAASTRIDPARLDAKLAELGAPIVMGSLAYAPQAPQAARFAAWLAAGG